MSIRRGTNAIKKRDNTTSQKSRRNQVTTKGGNGQRRGLGDRRSKGKTLSLAPAGGRGNRQGGLRKKNNNGRK